MSSQLLESLHTLYHSILKLKMYFGALLCFGLSKNEEKRRFALDMIRYPFDGTDAYYGKWVKKYTKGHADLYYDEHLNLSFFITEDHSDGHRCYIPAKSTATIHNGYAGDIEQDPLSPHKYITDELWNEHDMNGTILDLGSCEGNFALEVVDRAKKVYCFEPDDMWYSILKHTMDPFGDKVEIVKKFVGGADSENQVTIDSFFENNMPTDVKLIKMDIEGAEQVALHGMKRLLELNPDAVLLVCAYHSNHAEKEIRGILEGWGYSVVPRNGWILFTWDHKNRAPYLRRGVLEAQK